MLRSDFDCLIQGGALEQIEPRNPLLRLGKGAIGDDDLAVPPTDGPGVLQSLEPAPEVPHVHLGHPILDVVLPRDIRLSRRIDAHEQDVPHRLPRWLGSSIRRTGGDEIDALHNARRWLHLAPRCVAFCAWRTTSYSSGDDPMP